MLLKIHEQIDKTVYLIGRLPPENLDWRPAVPGAWPAGKLLGHLLEALAGFCAVLAAAEPERLAHFHDLRALQVNHACSAGEAIDRITRYRSHIDEGFAMLNDAKLGEILPTVFVRDGEPLMTLLLGNLEHLINHKHQLFTYLKEMGVAVGTRDLYHFRGE